MAPASGIRSNRPTHLPTSGYEHRFTVGQRDGDIEHEEEVVILATPFYRPGTEREFFECRTQSLPCCETIPDARVKHEIQRECDSLFQVGGWLEIDKNHDETPLSEHVTSEHHDENPLSEHVTSEHHGETPLSEHVTSQDHETALEFAKKYVTKVKNGLLKLSYASSKGGYQQSSYDISGLLKFRRNAKANDNGQELENYLKETRFKASFLSRVSNKQHDAFIDSIVKLLLETELEIEIPEHTPVMNPAFFISVVTGKL
ncbi:hypothetical protein DL764_008123 [Monosporascus ibericus]|uniref:Uncharacterized protein n=1 Tax=Monosporascus ibericus TaxID=155417 RepID=A0A4Q4T1N8_9PEZI|nr:hypothetical protein DL764_008123 [Monosporascus ibericus]